MITQGVVRAPLFRQGSHHNNLQQKYPGPSGEDPELSANLAMSDQRSRTSRRRDLAATGPQTLPDELVRALLARQCANARVSQCMSTMYA